MISMTLLLRWWLPFVNRSHTSPLEWASFSRSSNMNRHGSPSVFKIHWPDSWYRMFKFKAFNSRMGIEVHSLKHHRITPLNRCSVRRELRFCRKPLQNVDLTDPVGAAMLHVNGCLNLTSALIALVEMTLSPRNRLMYTQSVRTYYRLVGAAWKKNAL